MQSKDEVHKEEPAVAEKQGEAKPVPLPPPEASVLKKEEITHAAKAVEASIQNGQPLEMVDTKPVIDLLDEVGTGNWQLVDSPGTGEQVSAAYADVDGLKGASVGAQTGKEPGQELIDGADDISADALLKRAMERAEREGRDWAMKHETLVQARADEQTFREILDKARTIQQAKVAAAMNVAEANAKRAEEIQAAADAAQEQFAQILEDTVRLSNVQRDQELLRQAELLTTAAAEAAVRERSERAGTIDELRTRVNALGQAFSRRSDEQRDSTRAHQVSLGAFALEDALAHGRPYAAAASLLSQSCSEDDLVAAALQALPKEAADKGIPTRVELLQRAPGVAQNARQMAYIEPGSGGIVSLGLARLAASLKVPEGSSTSGEGTDGALASMQSHLAAGRLAEAADALEAGTKGTAAEKSASEWARDARARALADQTTALLQAHACSLAVSQS
ncbi:hypothetical protein WJX75_005876 [Coccomyxa subellipsoidea]|uniref:MICOS complex subunit MIC60 n=1 Tax=Coccomyxa subellipsoidea TaxID=248742 RepID=A0ABR2YGQ0_9CHLO